MKHNKYHPSTGCLASINSVPPCVRIKKLVILWTQTKTCTANCNKIQQILGHMEGATVILTALGYKLLLKIRLVNETAVLFL